MQDVTSWPICADAAANHYLHIPVMGDMPSKALGKS